MVRWYLTPPSSSDVATVVDLFRLQGLVLPSPATGTIHRYDHDGDRQAIEAPALLAAVTAASRTGSGLLFQWWHVNADFSDVACYVRGVDDGLASFDFHLDGHEPEEEVRTMSAVVMVALAMATHTRAVLIGWETAFEGPEADEHARTGTSRMAWDLELTLRRGLRRQKRAADFDLHITQRLWTRYINPD